MISVSIYVINKALSSAHVKFYTMKVEQGNKLRQVGSAIVEKAKDLIRGHTLKEEADVRRILGEPANISSKDVGSYIKEKLDAAVLSTVGSHLGGNAIASTLQVGEDALQKELERQRNLTPEQLTAEVIADAKIKAEKWHL